MTTTVANASDSTDADSAPVEIDVDAEELDAYVPKPTTESSPEETNGAPVYYEDKNGDEQL